MTESRKSRGGRPSRDEEGDVDRRLLDAALAMFVTEGFSGTSLEAVAKKAGAGKASLYARYPSKERLFTAVIERNASAFPPFEPMLPGQSLEERLRKVGVDMLQQASHPDTIAMMRLVIATANRFPLIAAKASGIGWEYGRMRVRQAVEIGPDLPLDPTGLVEAFVDLVFAPHQLRALLGEAPSVLLEQASRRVDDALHMLNSTGRLQLRSD